MAINELLDELEITIDQRLQSFSYSQLLSIVEVLTKRMRIRDLSQLLTDQQHFTIKNLFRTLERLEDGSLLLHLFNEPLKEHELRQSVEHWLHNQGLHIQTIDTTERDNILGWKEIGYSGRRLTRLWENKELWVIDTNLQRSQQSIDHIFSQARDIARSAQYCYVTITPYMWYKYSEVIRKKMDNISNIGVLLVDRSRVIKVLAEAQRNDVDKNRYNELKSALE